MYMVSLPMSVIMMLSATFWTARPSTLTGPMFARAPSAPRAGPGDSARRRARRRRARSVRACPTCSRASRASGLYHSFPRTHTCKPPRGHEMAKLQSEYESV